VSPEYVVDEGSFDDNADVTTASSMRDAALGLATEGFYVFPLPPRQKRATMPEWQKLATNDLAQVEAFFPNLTPGELLGSTESNIGIVAGRGLLVVDIDPRHGGDTSLINLQKEGGELPPTRSVRTPSGGQHLYFKVSTDRRVPNSTSKLGAGLDVKGDAGYVAAPPSVTDVGAYRWENPGAPIADAPAWLVERVTKPREQKAHDSSWTGSASERPKHHLTIAQIRDALSHLDPNCDYEEWAGILWSLRRMALGAQDGSTVSDWLGLADEWSRGSPKYPGLLDLQAKWQEADKREHGYGLRHLIELAKAVGWVPPPQGRTGDLSIFKPTTGDPGQPPSNRFRHIPLDEFLDRPEPEWLIEEVLPHGALACVYGEPNSGKSTVAIEMALALVRGIPWHSHPCKQGNVAYVAAESVGGVQKRLKAYGHDQGTDVKALKESLFLIPRGPNLLIAEDVSELIEHLKTLPKLTMVVLDTLARCTDGGNENSGEDMGRAIRHCQTIYEVTGAIVVLIHHSGKDQARGMRGWSGILGALDTEIEVTWDRDTDVRSVAIKKQRDGESNHQLFDCVMERVVYGRDSKIRELSSVVVREVPQQKMPNSAVRRAIRHALDTARQPMTFKELVKSAKDKLDPPDTGQKDRRGERIKATYRRMISDNTLTLRDGLISVVIPFTPVPEQPAESDADTANSDLIQECNG
jgi:hypothetical protein